MRELHVPDRVGPTRTQRHDVIDRRLAFASGELDRLAADRAETLVLTEERAQRPAVRLRARPPEHDVADACALRTRSPLGLRKDAAKRHRAALRRARRSSRFV